MNRWRKTGIAVLAGVGAVEAGAAVMRLAARRRIFAEASARAAMLHRPLVVIGDPDGGTQGHLVRVYGCGDLCLDLSGCPGCPVGQAVDLHAGVPSVADDSAVVFVSCVLEYVSSPSVVWAEILRMAGSAENAFVVNVQPWTITADYYPGAKTRVGGTTHGPTFAPSGYATPLAWAAALGAACLFVRD